MNLTKTLGLAFLGSALLFTSCNKDDDDAPDNNNQTCKVDKQYLYESGTTTATDTASYTYSGDKLTKLTVRGLDELDDPYAIDMNLEYSGNNISKRTYSVPGVPTPLAYDQVTYNSDGTISKIESFANETGTTNYVQVWRTDFTYTSGKVATQTEWSLITGTEEKVEDYSYTYTGNNITQVTTTDYSDPSAPETSTINVNYDSNNNYIRKQNTQAFLTDPFMGGLGLFLPLFYSANNVTSFSAGTNSAPVTYQLNDKQNLIEISIPVFDVRTTFTYLCP